MRTKILFLICCSLITITNLFSQGKEAAVTDKERAALLTTDSLFSKLSEEKGEAEAFFRYAAENATIFPAGSEIVSGQDQIKKYFADVPASTKLTWTPIKAEVAESMEMGYTYGVYKLKFNDDNGHPVYRNGKYVTVWKKQPDGFWKYTIDIRNSTPIPPGE